MPGLVKLQKEHTDIQVIGWHVGKGTPEEIEKVVKEQGLKYPVVATPGFDELKQWGGAGIPMIAVIDKKGELRESGLKPAVGEELAVKLAKE